LFFTAEQDEADDGEEAEGGDGGGGDPAGERFFIEIVGNFARHWK
jgi:hypothetical protein